MVKCHVVGNFRRMFFLTTSVDGTKIGNAFPQRQAPHIFYLLIKSTRQTTCVFDALPLFIIMPVPVSMDFVDNNTMVVGKDNVNNMEVITTNVDAFLQLDSCFPQLVDSLKISQGLYFYFSYIKWGFKNKFLLMYLNRCIGFWSSRN